MGKTTNTGAIRIPRSIESCKWFYNPKTLYCFIRLVMKAYYKDTEKDGISYTKGQVEKTSINDLAKEIQLTYQQTRTCLNNLLANKRISLESTNGGTIITICNYGDYQLTGKNNQQTKKVESTNEITNEQWDSQRTNQQTPIYKEEKKGEKEISENEKSNADALPEISEGRKLTPTEVMNLWNTICVRCSKIITMNESRAEKVRLRLKEMGSDEMVTTLFRKVNESDFLCLGKKTKDHPDWTVNFDWVFKNDKNWVHIMEGNYDNKRKGLLPLQREWRVKGRVYYKSDFVGHEDEYNSLDPPEKNRLKMGKGIVWMGEYWKRDDF